MRLLSKSLILLLLFILVIPSLSLVKPTNAQSIPKPSVPEFTVKYVDYSYDVPATYGIDQYTDQNITTQAGYHVDNRSIEFTIKNQPFTPYNDSSGHTIGLYYNFRYKGNYTNTWTYYPENANGQSVLHYSALGMEEEIYPPTYQASNSDYTTILLRLIRLGPPVGSQEIPNGATLQFQLQALVGYFMANDYGYFILTGNSSDWSSTQTVTIGETSTSPNPTQSSTNTISPTPTPTVLELSWLAILPLLIATPLIILILLKKKRS